MKGEDAVASRAGSDEAPAAAPPGLSGRVHGQARSQGARSMRTVPAFASMILLGFLALGAPPGPPAAADDEPPPYSWARVEPGMAFTLVAKTRAGPKHEEQRHESAVRYTLLSRTGESAKVRLELLVTGSPVSTQEQEVLLAAAADTYKGEDLGPETVTVGAGVFDCKHVKIVAEGVSTDVWLHPDVPVPVKSVTRLPDGGTELELVKIELVKLEEKK